MLSVGLPLNDLLPSKSPTLISLTTLWVNLLLRKAVKIKQWSWAYVLHILNNEAASITFDELSRESIRCSQGNITTQVFLSVLQNELLQDELSNFLKQFAQKLIVKGDAIQLHKVKNLALTVSSSVMKSSELRFELDSFMSGDYERVLQVCTTPDSSNEPHHLTAYLTVLLDDTDVSERLLTGCSDGEGQPNNSPADDPSRSSREAESISKVQDWLSQSDTSSSSPGTESYCQNQRMPIKEKSVIKQRQTNAIFRDVSSSGSDSEQVSHHGFSNPTRSFPTVAGTSEIPLDILPSRANTIRGESMESTNELLPSQDPSNIQPKQTELSTALSTESLEGKSSASSSQVGMSSLEADDSSDSGYGGTLSETKCHASVASNANVATSEPSITCSKPEELVHLKSLHASERNGSETSDCLSSMCKKPAISKLS